MTAQISDEYTYKGKKYDIIASSAPIEFDPNEHGFNPSAPHTACWRGYWCVYSIDGRKLTLHTLHINCDDNNYPDLFGTKAVKAHNGWDYGMEYRNIGYVVDFNGSVVLGRDFIQDYYIHMGFQQPWAYGKVIELVLEKGMLINEIDHSAYVADLRKKIDANPDYLKDLHSNIPLFAEKSFSLNAKDKAWWI